MMIKMILGVLCLAVLAVAQGPLRGGYDPRYPGYVRDPATGQLVRANEYRGYTPPPPRGTPYRAGQDPVYPPRPYANNYQVNLEDGGTFGQQETGDESGAKRGSYSIRTPEGFFRIVDYVADEYGFRASVRTNEPGTSGNGAADVQLVSEEVPYGYQGYRPYSRPGAYVAPRPGGAYYRPPVRPIAGAELGGAASTVV